jgi:predicted nucleic acid-binding protein
MMTLVDTSIWIDHFRRGDPTLAELLDRSEVVTHPFVIGELLLGRALGTDAMIRDLSMLPKAAVASADEILKFISDRKLPGSGIGYVDAHLLAAAALTAETMLWTRDKRLLAVAKSLSLAAEMEE